MLNITEIMKLANNDICRQEVECPHIAGRQCNSVQCANCRFNHCLNIGSFRNQVTPTAGTICTFDHPEYSLL